MAGKPSAKSLFTSSKRNLLRKSKFATRVPNSILKSSESDFENFRPVHPNIRASQQQQQEFQFTKHSLSKSPAFKNQIDSSDSRDKVSATRVVVRIRPEKEESWNVRKVAKDSLLVGDRQFAFDSVLDSSLNQADIFQRVGVPLVQDAFSGYNTCVLSCGQSGSGKTYTIWGPPSAMLEDPSPRGEQGLAPRIFQMLFSDIQKEKAKSEGNEVNYQCRCSFLEIYNGQISDLFDQTQRNLEIKDEKKNGIYVENLTEEYVDSYEDVSQILMKGLSSRKVGTTSNNSKSSRSHLIFSFIMESWRKGASSGCFSTRTSKITLVDLAGAERNKLRDVSKQCLHEEKFLKKSLSQLGHVVNALSTSIDPGIFGGILHRGSSLTHLLQEALGGNAKLTVMCNVSPGNKKTNETVRTLRFGERAKSIRNNPVINEISEDHVNDLSDQIRLLKEELIRAKADVHLSVGSKNDYSRAWRARESLNQLRVSLNRSLMLPKIDNDDDNDVTADEDDGKEMHQELSKLQGSFMEKLAKVSDSIDSINSSFVSATCEPEQMEDDKISSGESEADETELDKSLKEYDEDTATATNKSNEKPGTRDSAIRGISISPCHQSLILNEPMISESPKIRNTLKESMALSSSACLQNQNSSMSKSSKFECLWENEHIRSSLRSSKGFPGSTESLAASLQRGLVIFDKHRLNLSSSRSSVFVSSEDLNMQEGKKGTSIEIKNKASTDIQSPSLLCPSCQQKFENNLESQDGSKVSSVAVDGVSNSNERATKDVDHEMEKYTDTQKELENLCAQQEAKIKLLTQQLEQYTHQTENETSLPERAKLGDHFVSENENQLLNCNDIKGQQPDFIKQVQEDSQTKSFDVGEKTGLLNEIENLKSKLQSYQPASLTMSTDKLRSSLLARSIQLHKSTDLKNVTKEELEKERERWTEMESEWISLTDELRVDIETQRGRADKAEVQLKLEKLCIEELEDALHRAVLGHARFVEHYTELQEKYNNLSEKHKAMMVWIAELKRAMAKAGKRGCGSSFAKSLASELSASRMETERERDLLKKENRSLKIQLQNTAEAVHAAGELLVRLREAEQAASTAEENHNLVQEKNEKLRKKMEKLKRKHKMEMITMEQHLKETRLPESALQRTYLKESIV